MARVQGSLVEKTLWQLAENHDGQELHKALQAFGLAELLTESPQEAVPALFTACGYLGRSSAALQDVLRQPLSDLPGQGTREVAVLLPSLGSPLAGTLAGEELTFRGLLLGGADRSDLLVPAATENGPVLTLVDPEAVPVYREVSGLDRDLAIVEVAGSCEHARVVSSAAEAPDRLAQVVSEGRRALAYQILGAVDRMLEMTVEHACNRVQFGQPIGAFQAVRHRLADAFVGKEAACAALDATWEADDLELAAMLAKSLAGRAARIASTQCQQVLGGIGFTAEHPFHRFMLRVAVLDKVLGSSSELTAVIGARLAAGGNLPRLVQL